ncbi:hypothetical protein JI735_10140 [Paenibacillus sonchi]|uniref:Uncharacterized protein n=1 Tax=Paenibacillus sonchi TaxID=373687 RepID=A0A974SEE7_9BACL|nr:UPF0158 family protein [Paenibacillus sonchi]QQZ62847.1 hypothetical protein JI735_10140 [Paenibacillus sonchi]
MKWASNCCPCSPRNICRATISGLANKGTSLVKAAGSSRRLFWCEPRAVNFDIIGINITEGKWFHHDADGRACCRIFESFLRTFAYQTEPDPEGKLVDALNGYKPFRSFKDVLYELDLWDEWNAFEEEHAVKATQEWLAEENLDYSTLDKKYSSLHL